MKDLLTTRFFNSNDKRVDAIVFPLPSHWWSRFYEYAWAAEFCKKTDVVLDAACGIPHPFKFYLAMKCNEVHAIDKDISIADPDEIDRQLKVTIGRSLSEFPQAEKIKFKHGSISELPYKDNKFDTIFCLSVLEHLSSDKKLATLKEFKRTLNDDGKIILTVDYCTNKVYGSMTIDELEAMANESGLKLAGEKDVTIPENAITWNKTLFCFRCVLVNDKPVEEKPKDEKPTKNGRKKTTK